MIGKIAVYIYIYIYTPHHQELDIHLASRVRGQGSAIYVVARPELGVRHLVPCPDVALNDLLDAQMLPDVAAADRDVLRPWAAEDVMAVAQALVLVPVSQHAEEGVKGVARLALGGPASGDTN